MEQYTGKPIVRGIASGKIYCYLKATKAISESTISNPVSEIERLLVAKDRVIDNLKSLYEKTKIEIDEEHAMIFTVHQMILEDEEFLDRIINNINTEHRNAEYAVQEAGGYFSDIFQNMDNIYMRERAADFLAIKELLIGELTENDGSITKINEPCILLADDLTPSDTMQIDKNNLLAIVTIQGSVNSHTAILARMLNLPTLIKTELELSSQYHGQLAIVDSDAGEIYIDPKPEFLDLMQEKQAKYKERWEELKQFIGKEDVLQSGKKVKLYANIAGLDDVNMVIENDGAGIGLFRSEFLFLGKKCMPTEEEQFEYYKSVAQKMQGKEVIIRTLDIGADKQVDYIINKKEDNPALGCRGIRLCLSQPDLFKAQLRAIYRASNFGKISIMFPMIASVDEVHQIKQLLQQVKKELTEEGKQIGKVEIGIMIETPAAAMISDELAKEVDFFSIGTNDLTQYTLAIDRQNSALENYYNPHHKAIMRLIQLTVENGHKEGIWVGICGEVASDLDVLGEFIQMGIDELSVSPMSILEVRKKIRTL